MNAQEDISAAIVIVMGIIIWETLKTRKWSNFWILTALFLIVLIFRI